MLGARSLLVIPGHKLRYCKGAIFGLVRVMSVLPEYTQARFLQLGAFEMVTQCTQTALRNLRWFILLLLIYPYI